MMTEEFDSLEHVGVKGMKWGVRKKNPNYTNNQIKRDRQTGDIAVGLNMRAHGYDPNRR